MEIVRLQIARRAEEVPWERRGEAHNNGGHHGPKLLFVSASDLKHGIAP